MILWLTACSLFARSAFSIAPIAQPQLPFPPTVEYLKSVPYDCKPAEYVCSLPGITNFRAQVQAANDITGYRMFTAPPYTTRHYRTNNILKDGKYFEIFMKAKSGTLVRMADSGGPVQYQAYLNKVVRKQSFATLEMTSTLTMAEDSNAVLIKLSIKNTGATAWNGTDLLVRSRAGAKKVPVWAWDVPSSAEVSTIDYTPGMFISSDDGSAYAVFGSDRMPASIGIYQNDVEWVADSSDNVFSTSNSVRGAVIGATYPMEIAPGATWEIRWVHTLGETKQQTQSEFTKLRTDFDSELPKLEVRWNRMLTDAFTPNNTTFSGHLPRLKTSNESLYKLYTMSVATLLSHRRTYPESKYGATYVTLFPESGVTVSYLWDTQFASVALAQLDPSVLRNMLEQLTTVDMSKHYAIDAISGSGVGPWYAVNDYAFMEMAYNYLRYSGDYAWLDKNVNGKPMVYYLERAAGNWKNRRNGPENLADYGQNENLLEVLEPYKGKVASLNAANIWMNRVMSDIYSLRNEPSKAAQVRADAEAIKTDLQQLYKKGEGVWQSKTASGMNTTRHVYDFGVILNTIPDDLTDTQKKEMTAFFTSELQTPTWMRALSLKDTGIGEAIRPDHQSTGAYIAWPALSAQGLYNIGHAEQVSTWLGLTDEPGIASVTDQGIFGQAYWSGTGGEGAKLVNGAARKASYDYYAMLRGEPSFSLNNWGEIGGAIYTSVTIEGVFGLSVPLAGTITASTRLPENAVQSRLENVPIRGKNYTITNEGIAPAECAQWWRRFNKCQPYKWELVLSQWRCVYLQQSSCPRSDYDVNGDGKVSLIDRELLLQRR